MYKNTYFIYISGFHPIFRWRNNKSNYFASLGIIFSTRNRSRNPHICRFAFLRRISAI